MHFRTGTPDDATLIAALHTESWRSAYAGIMPAAYLNGPLLEERDALWTARLSREVMDASHLLIAERGGTLQGFAYLVVQPDDRVLLDNLHVRPDRKGSGIGRELMRQAFDWATVRHPGKTVYLEVLKDNAPAIAFYERCGGTVTREFREMLSGDFELPMIEYSWASEARKRATTEPVTT
ncbi:GNAT family N-acetyltransferase [Streptosporangium sp. KLBMP 9127]|nr:GNAT family N-acetyltransferase [Streptosporangium sp. KLBMP 9127]